MRSRSIIKRPFFNTYQDHFDMEVPRWFVINLACNIFTLSSTNPPSGLQTTGYTIRNLFNFFFFPHSSFLQAHIYKHIIHIMAVVWSQTDKTCIFRENMIMPANFTCISGKRTFIHLMTPPIPLLLKAQFSHCFTLLVAHLKQKTQ